MGCGVSNSGYQNHFEFNKKLINGTNGLKTDVTQLFGQMVGSEIMQRWFFWISAVLVILAWFFARWIVRDRFGNILIGIRDDEARVRFKSALVPQVYI